VPPFVRREFLLRYHHNWIDAGRSLRPKRRTAAEATQDKYRASDVQGERLGLAKSLLLTGRNQIGNMTLSSLWLKSHFLLDLPKNGPGLMVSIFHAAEEAA
jgi:hypothetical protein